MIKAKIILSLFLTSLLIFIFMTIPVFDNFLRNKRILDSKKEELHRQEQYFNQLKEINSTLNSYSPELKLVDLAISDESIVPSLIRYIEELSQNNGLFFKNVASVSKNSSNKFSDLKEIEISFLLMGDYQNFKNFIESLEKSIKIIEVKNVSVYFDLKEEKKALSYNITIKTYYY